MKTWIITANMNACFSLSATIDNTAAKWLFLLAGFALFGVVMYRVVHGFVREFRRK